MTRLSRVVLMLRNLDRSLGFFRDGLGLQVEAQTNTFARLCSSKGTAIELLCANSESQCCTGYSPFLTFEIDDMDVIVPRLIQHGAVLDGGIRYEVYGRVAAVRSPDGHMVGLIENANLPDGGDTTAAAAKAAKRHLESEETML